MNVYEINLKKPKNGLIEAVCLKDIPFDIKRIYYIFGVDKSNRGAHAHKELQQVFLMLKGSCIMHLDDGKTKQSVLMQDPTKALYVGNLVWHEMSDFSADAIFVAFAADEYLESDYIRNYSDFLKFVGGNNK